MKVVTVITNEDHKWFNLLRLSCAVQGLKLVVLVAKTDTFNNRTKDELLADYLSDENDNEIILFTDGIDTFFTATENEILHRFEKFGTNLLFSSEMNCWPDYKMANQYPQVNGTPYIYLNSGGFIGKAGFIKQLLCYNNFESDSFLWSNQYLWAKRYLMNTSQIKLDIFCSIFCTMGANVGNQEYYQNKLNESYELKAKWFEKNFCIEGTRILNKITKTYPCHFHFNGPSKLLLTEEICNVVYSNIKSHIKTELYYEQ